jgi:hypothetical protein
MPTIDERLSPGEPEPRIMIEKRFEDGCRWWDSVTISGVQEANRLVDILNKNSLYVYRIKID